MMNRSPPWATRDIREDKCAFACAALIRFAFSEVVMMTYSTTGRTAYTPAYECSPETHRFTAKYVKITAPKPTASTIAERVPDQFRRPRMCR